MAKIVPLHNDIPALLDLEPTVDPLRERFSNDVRAMIEQQKKITERMERSMDAITQLAMG